MSVLINGMEMPKSCGNCYMFSFLSDSCRITNHVTKEMNDKMFDRRFDDCPLIEVPEPHGRLIDADAIPYKKIMYDDDDFYYGVTKPYIDRIPTVIPASEEAK